MCCLPFTKLEFCPQAGELSSGRYSWVSQVQMKCFQFAVKHNWTSMSEQFSTEHWILDSIGFALLCSVIGPENSRHSLDQSDANLTPITTWSPAFSALFGLQGILLSSNAVVNTSVLEQNALWHEYSTSKFPIDKTSPSIRHFFRYLHYCNSKIKWRLIFQKENWHLKRTPRVLILFVYHSAHQITAPRALKANSLPSPGIKPRGSAANKTKILTSACIMSCDYPRKISLPKSNE